MYSEKVDCIEQEEDGNWGAMEPRPSVENNKRWTKQESLSLSPSLSLKSVYTYAPNNNTY
jgi:hypothetical protein